MKLAPLFGSLAVVFAVTVALADSPSKRTELTRVANDVGDLMAAANASFKRYTTAAEKLAALYAKLDEKVKSVGKVAAACQPSCNVQQGKSLLDATKQMQEMQMSFTLQYLQLQNQMQNENRSYTAVSNIMKTKHDTVKNSISNVR
jgi:hypothetical protein